MAILYFNKSKQEVYSNFQADLQYDPNGHFALRTEDSDFVNEHHPIL